MSMQKKQPQSSDGDKGRRGLARPSQSRSLGNYGRPLNRLRTEFDRLFDDFFQGWPAAWWGEHETGWGLDVQDRENEIVIRADAPGFEAGEFDVEIRGDKLVLSAQHSAESGREEEEAYQWQNRQLYHSIPLPAGIDADSIDAEYRNGVLKLRLPKTEQAKGRKIEIKG